MTGPSGIISYEGEGIFQVAYDIIVLFIKYFLKIKKNL